VHGAQEQSAYNATLSGLLSTRLRLQPGGRLPRGQAPTGKPSTVRTGERVCFPSLIGTAPRADGCRPRRRGVRPAPPSMRHFGTARVRYASDSRPTSAGRRHRRICSLGPAATEPARWFAIGVSELSSRLMEPTSDGSIAKVEHHLGELFPRVGSSSRAHGNETGPSSASTTSADGELMDSRKHGSPPLDSPLMSSLRATEVRFFFGVIATNLGNLLRRLFLPIAIKLVAGRAPQRSSILRRLSFSACRYFTLQSRRKLTDIESFRISARPRDSCIYLIGRALRRAGGWALAGCS